MEVQNKVRFSKSAVNKKAEQEIVEGVFPDNDITTDENTTVFENSMGTEPVAIIVKPTPQKKKPVEYNGATGNFKLSASLGKNELAKTEEVILLYYQRKRKFYAVSEPVSMAADEDLPTVMSRWIIHSHDEWKKEFTFGFVGKTGSYNLPT